MIFSNRSDDGDPQEGGDWNNQGLGEIPKIHPLKQFGQSTDTHTSFKNNIYIKDNTLFRGR